MGTRYTQRKVGGIRPIRSYWQDDAPMLPDISAPVSEPVNTGLLNAQGNEIWRQPYPMGFGRDEEWD